MEDHSTYINIDGEDIREEKTFPILYNNVY